jgi:hypothetical protein
MMMEFEGWKNRGECVNGQEGRWPPGQHFVISTEAKRSGEISRCFISERSLKVRDVSTSLDMTK